MGFRFNKRIKLLPGITMNLGKTGSSFSFGPRGARMTFGKNGVRKTLGLPGSGLSYSTYSKYGEKAPRSRRASSQQLPVPVAEAPVCNNVDVGFFSRLFMSGDEKTFIDGVKVMLNGDMPGALAYFMRIPAVADAAFIAAVLHLNAGRLSECWKSLEDARAHSGDLGRLFGKYNLDVNMAFPITELLSVKLRPSMFAVDLMAVEVLQGQKRYSEACEVLIRLYKSDPEKLLVKISLAELVLAVSPNDQEWLKTLLLMTDGLENESAVHTVLLYYRVCVLRSMQLYDAAQASLATLVRKKSDRPSELMIAIMEAQAEIYELQGRKPQARKTWAKIYTQDPSNALAASKLNI